MPILKNSDIETLIKMENLIGRHEKRLFCKETDDDDFVKYDPDTGITNKDFDDFWLLIENLLTEKRKASERANKWNKEHPDKHRENNKRVARKSK